MQQGIERYTDVKSTHSMIIIFCMSKAEDNNLKYGISHNLYNDGHSAKTF